MTATAQTVYSVVLRNVSDARMSPAEQRLSFAPSASCRINVGRLPLGQSTKRSNHDTFSIRLCHCHIHKHIFLTFVF